jgi:hypothetical protein
LIDWSRHWFGAVHPTAQRFGLTGPGEPAPGQPDSGQPPPGPAMLAAFNAGAQALGVQNASGQPLSFVPQDALPDGQAYEAFIGATGQVPTRDNLHDFFNGLVWLAYPRIKRQLNAMQAAQIAEAGVGKSRGPTRDGVTIFDENAALLVLREGEAGRALLDELRAHQWSAALFERRAAFGPDAQLWLFGHALMEKLTAPRKAITAHTRVVWVGDAFFGLDHAARLAHIDRQVAAELAEQGLDTSHFTPLPVLGVPGWWDGQDAGFYADATVFRPKRTVQTQQNGAAALE